MSTLSALQILVDVASSRSTSSSYARAHASNVQPPSWMPSAPVDATSATPEDASAAVGTVQPVQPPPPTEASLRAQLDGVDLYDLSGEKAAAEALKREDAFKEQQIQEKAQQTKEFFAEQDRKQQESLQDMQKQADAQLAEKSQKEFWEAKQAQETQATMDNELRGLHEAARQEHQQWRADFTQGICHDDAAALINGQIDSRVGAYHERLTDMGSNAVDAAATAEQYKVKLESESAAEIASRTAELHQEHFPEYQGIAPAKPDGPAPAGPDEQSPLKPGAPLPGEIPSTGFGPFEGGPQGGYGLEDLVNKKGDFGPWEATAGPTPDKPFMRPMMDPRGDGTDAPEGWFKNVDELPKQDAPPGWFKNIDELPAGGKDIPDGWMKPIDPPIGEQIGDALKSAGSSAAGEVRDFAKFAGESLTNVENLHVVAEQLDHAHEWGVVAGVPHDVIGQANEQVELMKEHGMAGFKAGIQINVEKAAMLAAEIQAGAQELGDKVKAGAQEFGEKFKAGAQELGEKAMAGAQIVKDNLTISSNETLDRMAREDVKPETEQNKGLAEIHTRDVAAEENASNLRLEAMLRDRNKDLGKSSAEIESSSAAFLAHAESVDKQMQPPVQAPAIAPEVQTAPANTPGPPIPLPPSAPAVAPITPAPPPSTPAVAPITPSMNL